VKMLVLIHRSFGQAIHPLRENIHIPKSIVISKLLKLNSVFFLKSQKGTK